MQVIYDTLIEQSEPMEVVAVLAHELGHWANWDTTRQLLISEVYNPFIHADDKVYLFVFFSLFSAFIDNASMYKSFGFSDKPALIGFLLFNDLWQPIDHVIKLGMQILSRRNEYSAGILPKYN
jgi:STE24 endopeptidase